MSSDAKSTEELLEELKALRPGRERYIQSLSQLTAGVAEGFERVSVPIGNQTAMVLTLKARQAVASIAQATSLVIMLLWLIFIATKAIFRCVTEKQQAHQEEMVKMLEASLARRKAKQRAMVKPEPTN